MKTQFLNKDQESLVDCLDKLTQAAIRGEIKEVVIAMTFEGGDTGSMVGGSPYNPVALLGQLEIAKLRLLDDRIEM